MSDFQTLKSLSIFKEANDETIRSILNMSRVAVYKKNNYVFYDQEVLSMVYIVLSGKISMYKMSENGQKRIIFILGEGEILNDDLTQSLPSAINCQVFEVSHVLICSKSRFLQLMQQDFGLTLSVLEQYSARGRRSYRQLKNAPSNIAIGKKVAAKLYKLAFDYGELQDGKTVIKLNLSVTYLADMLSSQRETVSRAIKLLCDESLISYTDKQIVVHDMKKLSDYFKGKTTSS